MASASGVKPPPRLQDQRRAKFQRRLGALDAPQQNSRRRLSVARGDRQNLNSANALTSAARHVASARRGESWRKPRPGPKPRGRRASSPRAARRRHGPTLFSDRASRARCRVEKNGGFVNTTRAASGASPAARRDSASKRSVSKTALSRRAVERDVFARQLAGQKVKFNQSDICFRRQQRRARPAARRPLPRPAAAHSPRAASPRPATRRPCRRGGRPRPAPEAGAHPKIR